MIITTEMLYGNSCEMLQTKMVVYKIRCLIDDKIYVGKTARTLKERLREHVKETSTLYTNSYVDRAIHKYGIEKFDVAILEECENEEALSNCEMKCIAELNCKFPNGYNLTDGGDGITGYKAPPELSERLSKMRKGRGVKLEVRKKISDALSGREFSDEHKAKISESKRMHPVSEELRQKLKISNTGKKANEKTRKKMSTSRKNKRAVICVETGQKFESVSDAAKWAGVSGGTITYALNNENRTAGNYHWIDANEITFLILKNAPFVVLKRVKFSIQSLRRRNG